MGQNIFFLRDDSFFLKNLVLDFFGPTKNHHLDCDILVEKHCGPLYIVQWQFLCSIMREKVGEVFSFLRKSVLFFKTCVFSNLLRPKKWSYCYHSICQNIFSALIKRPWGLSHSTIWENIRQTQLFTWILLFFQKIVLSTTF